MAEERGEALGHSVGYQIRAEARRSASTRLLFCTTGVLLRRLINDPLLHDVTHVVVDEIHERGMSEDFLLIVLRVSSSTCIIPCQACRIACSLTASCITFITLTTVQYTWQRRGTDCLWCEPLPTSMQACQGLHRGKSVISRRRRLLHSHRPAHACGRTC